MKGTQRALLSHLPCEDSEETASVNQEVGLHQTLNRLAP